MSDQKSYKETLNLPKTDFSIRANAKQKEPELLARWDEEKLYSQACKQDKSKKKFVLHDGPPFANGHMHMGHALNRTLKDIVGKVKRMSGYKVISSPGWDCHGLPIELKVAKELEKDSSNTDPIIFKKKCREYAQKWIDIQKEEIKRLGVLTDWDNPYITMDPVYEGAILKAFADFVEKGYIERKGKTVPWCASCQTVLATAEIEYQDKKDPSCYILFPFDKTISQELFSKDLDVSLLIWTTTPWTIPLNRAVVLHPTAKYVLLQGKNENEAFIVGEQLADKICKEVGIEKKVLLTIDPKKLEGKLVNHPYIKDLQVPIILDNMVLLDDGTACVHSASGCGPEDYIIGIKNDLEIFSPLSSDGKYTEDIKPDELVGMSVFDGQIWSIKELARQNKLFHKSSIRHSYPHCWRCHNPLIFRATDQWFCDLHHENLVERTIDEANKLKFVPDWGKTRLTSSIASRTEWCLSRQRRWGVPIPAIICQECDKPYMNASFIRSIAEQVKKEGIEYWDRVSIEELSKQNILPKDFSCASCKNANLSQFRKEMDILDVWFESGVSHTAAKEQYPTLQIPADVYLEGSDQHRGWFQSSILSSMVMYDKPCTKSFVTHSFVLDAQAQKMSKSKGNIISPQDVIEKYSADILRLWVAGSNFEDDIIVSDELLKNISEVYRKIRNTIRFLLSNLYDFDSKKDLVPIEKLSALDQYALARLQEVIGRVKNSYDDYWLTDVFHTLNRYCTNDLSSFYLDIIKDRLYVEKSDGHLRRSSQTVMYHILTALTPLIAPILSFLAEEISDNYQEDKKSIHLQLFPESLDIWEIVSKSKQPEYLRSIEARLRQHNIERAMFPLMVGGFWNLLERVRPELLKAIESKREVGLVKHSLEAKVTVFVDKSHEEAQTFNEFISYLREQEDHMRFFKDFIIVSQFDFSDKSDDLDKTGLPWLYVNVEHADGNKCPRCWQYEKDSKPDELCTRCKEILT
jgi:isoleucyl-tRNA synthetase